MAVMGNNSPSPSINSSSESVISKEVFQNVGCSAGAAPKGALVPVTIFCNTGDDIIMKICSVCDFHERTPFLISIVGYVLDPSTILFGNRIKHMGVYSILNLAGFASPFGTEDASTSLQFTISIGSRDGKVYGGRVSAPLIAASKIQVILVLNPPAEDSIDDTSSDADTMDDAESRLGL